MTSPGIQDGNIRVGCREDSANGRVPNGLKIES